MAAPQNLKLILEAALLAAGRPLSLDAMLMLFMEEEQPDRKELREALEALAADYQGRGIEVREVASGWRIQVGSDMASWVSRLWEEKPGRYSRATMETLALIAYRQPITRGEIEDIRGVSVNTNTIKTLLEREWIRVVGHRDVPGKPALYGTTREFLDYFNLRSLDDLPTLAEIRDLDEINRELNLEDPGRVAELQAAGAAALAHSDPSRAAPEPEPEPEPQAQPAPDTDGAGESEQNTGALPEDAAVAGSDAPQEGPRHD